MKKRKRFDLLLMLGLALMVAPRSAGAEATCRVVQVDPGVILGKEVISRFDFMSLEVAGPKGTYRFSRTNVPFGRPAFWPDTLTPSHMSFWVDCEVPGMPESSGTVAMVTVRVLWDEDRPTPRLFLPQPANRDVLMFSPGSGGILYISVEEAGHGAIKELSLWSRAGEFRSANGDELLIATPPRTWLGVAGWETIGYSALMYRPDDRSIVLPQPLRDRAMVSGKTIITNTTSENVEVTAGSAVFSLVPGEAVVLHHHGEVKATKPVLFSAVVSLLPYFPREVK